MAYNCLVSICIPCFKRIEQVRSTLKSIFVDNADVSLDDYEVVITDNDPEHEVKIVIEEFSCYPNLRYISTDCEGFMNSYHALKNGRGELLKLHNSQNKIKHGMLEEIVKQVRDNLNSKPLIFHTNGLLYRNKIDVYHDFDSFMRALSYWSSWSGGMTIWKDDFDRLGELNLNPLFPHTSVFLTQFFKKQFILDDRKYYKVQRIPKRGDHNKFEAFTIHYPSLIFLACEHGHISVSCRDSIMRAIYMEFIPILLFNKYIARIETFDSSGFKENCKKYFPDNAYVISWIYVIFVPFMMLRRRFF